MRSAISTSAPKNIARPMSKLLTPPCARHERAEALPGRIQRRRPATARRRRWRPRSPTTAECAGTCSRGSRSNWVMPPSIMRSVSTATITANTSVRDRVERVAHARRRLHGEEVDDDVRPAHLAVGHEARDRDADEDLDDLGVAQQRLAERARCRAPRRASTPIGAEQRRDRRTPRSARTTASAGRACRRRYFRPYFALITSQSSNIFCPGRPSLFISAIHASYAGFAAASQRFFSSGVSS